MDVDKELRNMGLAPLSWDQVMERVRQNLGNSEIVEFLRLHRNFTQYLSEATLRKFYGFVFDNSLQHIVNCYRFQRLKRLWRGIELYLRPGIRILEIGAGPGILARLIQIHGSPSRHVVQDICPSSETFLNGLGFELLPKNSAGAVDVTLSSEEFDLIVCADSLGELHSDEDDWLKNPQNQDLAIHPAVVEERYGFTRKLEEWKFHLTAGGIILLWEPFPGRKIFNSISKSLEAAGWKTRICEHESIWLELSLMKGQGAPLGKGNIPA